MAYAGKEYYREYRRKNEKKIKQYQKLYCENNQERLKQYHHEKYQRKMLNPIWRQERNEKNRQWRKNNPQYHNLYFQNRYRNDKKFREKTKEYIKCAALKIRDKIYVYNHNYRARRFNAEGSFTFQERNELFKKYNNQCLFCNSKEHLTIDHIIPLSLGGTNYMENLQLLCRSCNSRKSNQILSE